MTRQNPFSLYDFLGYIIPGALLIYTYLFIEFYNQDPSNSFVDFLDKSSKSNFEGVFIFIIISYTLGHLLSFISSISIEKYGNWKYGYPSKYLIGYEPNPFWLKKNKLNFIQFVKINIWRLMIVVFLLPTTIMDYLLGNVLGFKKYYQSNLDEFLIKAIKFKVSKLIKKLSLNDPKVIKDFNSRKDDFHRIVTHYTFENCKQHQFRMVNYVALYGFLRNVSLIFNCLAWYYLYDISKTFDLSSPINFNEIIFLTTLMLTSYIGFMAFMKFYRRYTLEGLMLVVIDENLK